ncbi:spike base protein, RCAP_Rcc01079 family [Rhodoferax aquaticus]|uniref:Uncharacterized protein n=1 Tax=Rhodoferax aquaticus TaxID=2527691 RepID=A0A515EKH3_9BURK|nr:hypothetical protein [Rhodoferax aquaticus]QDL53109.1 hypothetical protein EXZ61_02385 [Rhodoferax aquaticus]
MPDYFNGPTAPAQGGFAVLPDANFTQPSRALVVCTGGSLSVLMIDGTTVVFSAIASGTQLPLRATKVIAAGTTATNIVALY